MTGVLFFLRIFEHRDTQRCNDETDTYKARAPKIIRRSPEAGREAWGRFSTSALGRTQTCQRLDLTLLASRTVIQWISVVEALVWWFVTAPKEADTVTEPGLKPRPPGAEPKLLPLCYGGCWWHSVLLRHTQSSSLPLLPFSFPHFFIFSSSTISTFLFISFHSYYLSVGCVAKSLKLRLQTTNTDSVSVGQELGCGFTGCLWLQAADEIASAAVGWGWGWGISG